jgi:hypothetical protein
MAAGAWFWIVYVIVVVVCGFLMYPLTDKRLAGVIGVLMVLIGLLGWGVFGGPLK